MWVEDPEFMRRDSRRLWIKATCCPPLSRSRKIARNAYGVTSVVVSPAVRAFM